MPNTTSRLALLEPIGTDAASELRLSITNHATTLDNAVTYTQGTLASRPAAGLAGREYRATDTGLYYLDNGAAWQTVSVLGGPYGPLVYRLVTGTSTAVAGQFVAAGGTGTYTVTLPAVSASAVVMVANFGNVVATVAAAGGASIFGLGASAGVASVLLGVIGASVTLMSDGTNWFIVGGQQDTGWLALTLSSCTSDTSSYTPAARWHGNEVELRGTIISSGAGINATLPTGIAVPAAIRVTGPGSSFGGTFFRPQISSGSAALATVDDSGSALSPASGARMTLAGFNYWTN